MACLLIAANCVFSLNPFLKFDGYWILADALGVNNLSRQPGRLLAWLRDRARGRTASLPWAPALTLVLALYSIVTVAVWARFLGFAVPAVGRSLAGLPALAAQIVDDLHRGGRPSWGHVSAFALACYFALLGGLALLRVAHNVYQNLAARLTR